jgi:hypothetical protein
VPLGGRTGNGIVEDHLVHARPALDVHGPRDTQVAFDAELFVVSSAAEGQRLDVRRRCPVVEAVVLTGHIPRCIRPGGVQFEESTGILRCDLDGLTRRIGSPVHLVLHVKYDIIS